MEIIDLYELNLLKDNNTEGRGKLIRLAYKNGFIIHDKDYTDITNDFNSNTIRYARNKQYVYIGDRGILIGNLNRNGLLEYKQCNLGDDIDFCRNGILDINDINDIKAKCGGNIKCYSTRGYSKELRNLAKHIDTRHSTIITKHNELKTEAYNRIHKFIPYIIDKSIDLLNKQINLNTDSNNSDLINRIKLLEKTKQQPVNNWMILNGTYSLEEICDECIRYIIPKNIHGQEYWQAIETRLEQIINGDTKIIYAILNHIKQILLNIDSKTI